MPSETNERVAENIILEADTMSGFSYEQPKNLDIDRAQTKICFHWKIANVNHNRLSTYLRFFIGLTLFLLSTIEYNITQFFIRESVIAFLLVMPINLYGLALMYAAIVT